MESRFSQQSDLYARYRPDYPRELYDFIFDHLERRDVAWDCATGSGQVASVLAEYFEQVYASDISEEQMGHAPEKPNIQYVKAPAEDTDFDPQQFDLITVAQAIHWFDFDGFYREVNRTAKDGTLLAVFGYGMLSVIPELDKLLHDFYDQMFGLYFSDNRKFLDERYQTIPFPFEEIPAPDFERNLEWTRADLEGFLNSWSPVQQYKNDHQENPVDPLLEKIRPIWETPATKTVTFPMFLRLGRMK